MTYSLRLPALLAVLLLAGCNLLGSDDPAASETWAPTGPYGGHVTHLTLGAGGQAYALAQPAWYDNRTRVYERETPDGRWREVMDDGITFLYAGPSGMLYTGRSRGGLRWRTPGGTWRNEADAFRRVNDCTWIPSAVVYDVVEAGGQAYAGTPCGLFRVPGSFERVAFEGRRVHRLAAHGPTLLALVDGALYRHTGGSAWTQVRDVGEEAEDLVAAADGDLYARAGNHLWHSADDGVTWADRGPLPRDVWAETRLAAAADGVLLATGVRATSYSWADAAFVRSADHGATWQVMPGRQEAHTALAAHGEAWLAASPVQGLRCGTGVDAGRSCSSGLPTTIASVAAGPEALYAYTAARAIYRSTDGLTWTFLGVRPGVELMRLNGTLALLDGAGRLAYSDDGTRWMEPDLPFAAEIAVDVPGGGILAFDAHGRLWHSADGLTWTDADAPAPLAGLTRGLDGRLYAAAQNGTLYTSTDAQTWTEAFAPIRPAPGVGARVDVAVAADGTAFYYDGDSYRWDGHRWTRSAVSLVELSPDAGSGHLFAGGERVYVWQGRRWRDLGAVPERTQEVVLWQNRLYARTAHGLVVRDRW